MPSDSAHGERGGLLVAMRWLDPEGGRMGMTVLHAGHPVWGCHDGGAAWDGVVRMLDGLGVGLAGAAGPEGLGIAFADAGADGHPDRLRFEVVGEELDVVGPGGRRRVARMAAMGALRGACDEIAARVCAAGRGIEGPTRWALRRPSLRAAPRIASSAGRMPSGASREATGGGPGDRRAGGVAGWTGR